MPMSRRTARALVTIGVIAGLGGAFVVGGVLAEDRPDPAPRGTATGSGLQPVNVALSGAGLEAAGSCDELLAWYVERGVDRVTAYGWDGPPGNYGTLDGSVIRGEVGGMVFDRQSPVPANARAAAPRTARATNSATGTNVQEAGVDESDVVKTDGSILVRAQGHELTTYDVTGAEVERLGSLDLPDLGGA
ncbi:MAG: hypothetical protein JWO11_3286, partial [Nocardioides sp.]|nr:hypothetical protein [Nocardioides sp.]